MMVVRRRKQAAVALRAFVLLRNVAVLRAPLRSMLGVLLTMLLRRLRAKY